MSNSDYVWDYLRRKGLSPAQTAGVVGGLSGESGKGLDPTAMNHTSGAFGAGQWLGARKAALLKRRNPNSIQTQMDFLWSELQGPERAAFNQLRGAHTIADATNAWVRGFERPSPGEIASSMPSRLANARNFFNQYSGRSASSPARNGPAVPTSALASLGSGSPINSMSQLSTILKGLDPPQQVTAGVDPNQPKMGLEAFGLPGYKPPSLSDTVSQLASFTSSQGNVGATPTDIGTPASGNPAKGFKAGVPVIGLTSEGGEHQTDGLAGFPAHDYFAKPGSTAVAPVSGTVIKLSGHDPKNGPTNGPHGPLGWSVYIRGDDGRTYFLTHLGSRAVKLRQKIRAGTPIGTVANYDKYGTPSHIHMGVSSGR